MGQKWGIMPSHNNYTKSSLVFARAIYYKTKVRVYIPNIPFQLNGFEVNSSCRHSLTGPSSEANNDNIERSLRRTRKKLSDYILCNTFELFITFTFATNRQDIEEKRRQMSNWLRNQRKCNGKFDYIIVPELHKDKQSLHFHALFNGYCGSIKQAINPKTELPLFNHGQPVYVLPEYTLGFNNAKRIVSDNDSQERVASYVRKYITKDTPLFYGKQRYWASKDLKLPIIQNNPEKWYLAYKPDWEIENEFGRILEFKVGNCPIIDMLWEKYQ